MKDRGKEEEGERNVQGNEERAGNENENLFLGETERERESTPNCSLRRPTCRF